MRARHNLSRIGAKHVYYDNVLVNDIFIVDQIYLETFPQFSDTTVQIPGSAGDYFCGSQPQSRHGSMRLSLNTMSRNYITAFDAFKEMADLFSFTEIKKLDFGRFHVFAKCTSASDFEQVGIFLSTVLEFVCYDPYLYYKTVNVPLKSGENTFINTSPSEIWPTLEIRNASAPLTISNLSTGEKVAIPSGITSSSVVRVDMQRCRCTVNSNYLPVNTEITEFFALQPGDCSVSLSSGSGTLTYTERRL